MYVENLVENLELRNIKIQSSDVILGFGLIKNKIKCNKDINVLILYGKHYIWKCRTKHIEISVNDFKLFMKDACKYDSTLNFLEDVL